MQRIIRWEPVMATGVHFMDEEHHQLIDEVAALEAAFAASDLVAVGRIFQSILDHTESHFANEELAMRQHRCAERDYVEHKQEHDEFLRQLRFFHARLGRCGVNLHRDIIEFVSAWMVAHMLGQDRKIGLHMAVRAA